MATRRCRRFTSRETADVFKRFKAGERLTDIARDLDRGPGAIHQLLGRYGGLEPPKRTRGPKALSLAEREEISRSVAVGEKVRAIAGRLGRSPSTVSREICRNGGVACYRASHADERAWDSARRPKPCKLQQQPALAQVVVQKLEQNWSPQQISGWLRVEHPMTPEMNVSSETIYRTLFVQARGALKKELVKHLRLAKSMRQPKKASKQESKILDAIPISERPAEIEDRAVPGHWEGDLIAGHQNKSFIGTLVERHTRFVKLVKIETKDAEKVAEALKREVLRLPEQMRRSITWDRGTEMAKHKDFTVATDVKVYFCDPHSPWQRGSNENTNGLLRQYFPKGTVLSGFTQEELDEVAKQLNERPRLTLRWKTPAQTLNQLVATTG